jgi:hypothetical protein
MSTRADIAMFRRALDTFESWTRADEMKGSKDDFEREEIERKYRKARNRVIAIVKMFVDSADMR